MLCLLGASSGMLVTTIVPCVIMSGVIPHKYIRLICLHLAGPEPPAPAAKQPADTVAPCAIVPNNKEQLTKPGKWGLYQQS